MWRPSGRKALCTLLFVGNGGLLPGKCVYSISFGVVLPNSTPFCDYNMRGKGGRISRTRSLAFLPMPAADVVTWQLMTQSADQPAKKNLRRPTASKSCPCWAVAVQKNSFSKLYVYARWFVRCYRTNYVSKMLILWSWQRRFFRLRIHNIYPEYMYNRALYYVRI
jgi:hypothetical protein